MEGSRGITRQAPGRRRWPGSGRRGAVIVTALAVSDVTYRLLVREHVRRALGMQPRGA